MSQQNGYIGRSPGDSAVIIASQTFEPTGVQTNFTFASGYTVGYLDVYFNGSRLIFANDYTATDGSTVGLTTHANNGDVIECVAYKAFNVGNVEEATGNFTVGNQLTVTGFTTGSSAFYSGIVTATSFSGDGSSLTGLANTDVINTENINVIGVATVGSAVTINSTGIDAVSGVITAANFVGGGANLTALSGSNIASGTVAAARVATLNQNTTGTSAGLTGTPDITIRNVTGVAATFTGVLTYEDVTNVDSVGIVTARSGVEFGAAGVGGTITGSGNAIISGFSTFNNDVTFTGTTKNIVFDQSDQQLEVNGDNSNVAKIAFGDAHDFQIYKGASGGNVFMHNASGTLNITQNSGTIKIDKNTGDEMAHFIVDGAVELFHNSVKKLSTRSDGAEIHAAEGGEAILYFTADEGDEATDKYRIAAQDSGDLIIQRHSGSGYSSELRVKSAGGVQANYQGSQKLLTITEGVKVTGVTSTTSLSVGPGVLQEKLYNVASALTGTVNFDVVDNGLVQYYTTNSSGTFVVNLRGDGSTTFNSLMDIGKTTVFTLYSASNNASYYMTDFQIDGSSQTEKWNGGSAPTAGTGSGTDVYTFNIMKTADATFTVFANFSNFA
tara:strand:+ start:60 stop:1895 length:1836 start_codon:yes stop_codon:yes gene_type:complete